MNFVKCSANFPAQDSGIPLVPPEHPESHVDYKSFKQKVRILSLRVRLQSPAQLRTHRIQMNNEHKQDKILLGGTQMTPTLETKEAKTFMRVLDGVENCTSRSCLFQRISQMPYSKQYRKDVLNNV